MLAIVKITKFNVSVFLFLRDYIEQCFWNHEFLYRGIVEAPVVHKMSHWRQNYQILLKFSYLKSGFRFPNRNSELPCVRALNFIT